MRLKDADFIEQQLQDLIKKYEHRMPEWSPNDCLTSGKDAAFKNGYIADGIEKALYIVKMAQTFHIEAHNGIVAYLSVDATDILEKATVMFEYKGKTVKEWIDYIKMCECSMVKQGRWEQVDDNKSRCTNCGCVAMIALYPNGANNNYCPNCGAKMKGVEENDTDC